MTFKGWSRNEQIGCLTYILDIAAMAVLNDSRSYSEALRFATGPSGACVCVNVCVVSI